jgi:molybdopterin adenylyltransferase
MSSYISCARNSAADAMDARASTAYLRQQAIEFQHRCTEAQHMTAVKIGIVTVSDRASAGVYEDKGGPAIAEVLRDFITSAWEPVVRVISDDDAGIRATLIALADVEKCNLILTTGGTGPAPRDVTPEATEAVCQKMMPGFGELMRKKSLEQVPTAILSRQTAGIRGSTLIVNLPGRPQSIRMCLDAVFPAIPYCIDLIGGGRIETDPSQCQVFRPKS